ncbi:MAG: ABC transporter permease [Candidatus Competibacterales bacterium]
MAVFYLYPLLQVLWLSVSEPNFGLGNYYNLATSRVVGRVTETTVWICGLTTVITVALGYIVAYAMVHVGRHPFTAMMFCVLLTFWLSVLVRAFAWVMLLRSQGPVSAVLQAIGIFQYPTSLARNEIGVDIGMVHFMLPLAILPLYANMSGIDKRLIAAARGLGAKPWQAFLQVFLPLSQPGLIAATVLVLVFSLGFFITPAILGGGKVVMVAEYIRVSFEETLRWGQATALASSLLIVVLLLLLVMGRFADLKTVFGAR